MKLGLIYHISRSLGTRLRLTTLAFLLLVVFPAAARAQFDTTVVGNGQISFTLYTGSGGAVVIPTTYNGGTVVSIANGAFSYASTMTSVSIPSTVTSIGASAFYGCTGLTTITIPSSVTSIGVNAFGDCPNMTSISMPASNSSYSSVGGVLFNTNQTTLIQVPGGLAGSYTIPSTVTSVGSFAFFFCPHLTSITITGNVTSIGLDAFQNCTGLTTITIPGSVTNIGVDAFEYCSGMTSISVSSQNSNFSNNVDGALFNKGQSQLIQYPEGKTGNSYTIPGSVTSIGTDAFNFSPHLTSVTIPSSVTSIGATAFSSCANLANAYFQGTAPSMGASVFSGDASGFTVTYYNNATGFSSPTWTDSSNDSYTAIDFVPTNPSEFTTTSTDGEVTILGFTGTEATVIIPLTFNGMPVISIGPDAFAMNSTMTSVSIPSTVTDIGEGAFESCTALTSVTIPNNVADLEDDAFDGCTSLGSVTIGSGVTSLGNDIFDNCIDLTSVTIPSTVTSIGIDTFMGTGLTSVTIPTSVTSIGQAAFSDCLSLGSATIGDGVTVIGRSAFQGCASLSSVSIGKGVTTINADVFQDCTSLASITVSAQNVDFYSAGGVLFADSPNTLILYPLAKAGNAYTIPSGVTAIDENAFDGSSLTSITLPNSLTSIGQEAFNGCASLTSATFPGTVTTIGPSAFNGCTSLTNLIIPDSVTTIGAGAFSGCSALTTVRIGSGVTNLGSDAFSPCASLTSAVFSGNAPSTGSGIFLDAAGSFTVYYNNGATGFMSPTWMDGAGDSYPSVDIGDFSAWAGQPGYFTTQELNTPSISGPSATPENDGVPNLLKYLFDINPTIPMAATDYAALPVVGAASNGGTSYITLTYRQLTGQPGVTVAVQISPNLQAWTTLTQSSTATATTYTLQQVGTDSNTKDPIMQVETLFTGSKQFIRLSVSQ
jgi:hypothetical protein